MVLLAAGAWIYRLAQNRMAEPQGQKVTLDFRFTIPIGYEFCVGKSQRAGDDRPPDRLAHKNLALTVRLPEALHPARCLDRAALMVASMQALALRVETTTAKPCFMVSLGWSAFYNYTTTPSGTFSLRASF
jgi:hypothetical protein